MVAWFRVSYASNIFQYVEKSRQACCGLGTDPSKQIIYPTALAKQLNFQPVGGEGNFMNSLLTMNR